MAFTGISLTDKTVVISGPFGLLVQSLTQALTESGADVTLLTDDAIGAQRFCHNITDLREVSDKYGRAAALELIPKSEEEACTGFARSAEYFGTADAYVDTHLYGAKIPYFKSNDTKKGPAEFEEALNKTRFMTSAALKFVRGRSRSRLLYLFNEYDLLTLDKEKSSLGADFTRFIKEEAQKTLKDNITINGISTTVTEEFLLTRFPRKPSIQLSLKELNEAVPQARLIDYNDISNVITFIVSPYSSAITGQVLSI